MQKFLILSLAVGYVLADAITFRSGKGFDIRMKRFTCTYDAELTTNVTCFYKPGRKIFGIFTAEVIFLKPANHIFFTLDTYAKNSANRYMPSLIRMPKIDLCNIVNNEVALTAYFGMMTALYPPFFEKFGYLVHSCPYYGTVSFRNKTITQLKVPSFVATTDVKAVFRFFDPMNKSFFDGTLLLEIKGSSMVSRS